MTDRPSTANTETVKRQREQAAKHLDDCPFSIPIADLPWFHKGSAPTSCVCYSIRWTRWMRQENDRTEQP